MVPKTFFASNCSRFHPRAPNRVPKSEKQSALCSYETQGMIHLWDPARSTNPLQWPWLPSYSVQTDSGGLWVGPRYPTAQIPNMSSKIVQQLRDFHLPILGSWSTSISSCNQPLLISSFTIGRWVWPMFAG